MHNCDVVVNNYTLVELYCESRRRSTIIIEVQKRDRIRE